MTPELREFLMQPVPLIITKANVRSRVHRRIHMDYVGVKRFDRQGQLVGEARIVGLFTSTAYTRSTKTIPYLRRKVDRGADPRRLRSRRPFRQGAGQRAGELSARRAVPDRRRDAVPPRHGGDAAGRPAAGARAAARGSLPPLRLGHGLCAARPLRHHRAPRHRQSSGPGLRRPGLRLLSLLPRWSADPRPFHHRPQRGRDAARRPRGAGDGGLAHRAHLERRARRGHRPHPRPGQGRRSHRPLPRGLLRRLSRGGHAGSGHRRHPHSRKPVGPARPRHRLLPPGGWRAHRGRPQGLLARPPDPPIGARADP